MKKTKRLILLLFIGVIIGGPFLVYDILYGNPIRSLLMENATKKHLLKLGYNSDELLEVKTFYSMKKDTGIKRTRARVIFKDEPEEKYVYIRYEKNREIQQGCSYFNTDTNAYENEYTEKRKHMVRDCINTLFSM
ncbi:DUF3139 domain-containing protein [Peribacillus huizhouensis]|uniref:DUF3139 domain-containing protein n=1 Tax=Peribacillus huizhouensis TaxID=1501239 RepID=A0ABR6CWD6_9BACI|nr:DUF3139 domain-containing protein [Peribacillus huizhouensis]MBA9029320.1 hypothetical protein [Peribacillus huizhouensis]